MGINTIWINRSNKKIPDGVIAVASCTDIFNTSFLICEDQNLQGYLHGMTDGEDMPKQETLGAFKEGDEMLANGTGKRYNSTSDLFADMEA